MESFFLYFRVITSRVFSNLMLTANAHVLRYWNANGAGTVITPRLMKCAPRWEIPLIKK